jgi:hypothetical protein
MLAFEYLHGNDPQRRRPQLIQLTINTATATSSSVSSHGRSVACIDEGGLWISTGDKSLSVLSTLYYLLLRLAAAAAEHTGMMFTFHTLP